MAIINEHVLVIDDNEDILFMLQAMLRLKGYAVSIKDNTENIEGFIAGCSPDVILMDMLLSGADGREVCKLIKANAGLNHIPVIMISAHPQARLECLNAGANYFLGKPFEMNDLYDAVSNVLLQV